MTNKEMYIKHTNKRLNEEIKHIKKMLIEKIDKADKSGALPENWYNSSGFNDCLLQCVIDSFCLDRRYLNNNRKSEFRNLHKFI